jgi:two-component system cell cycle response regulator
VDSPLLLRDGDLIRTGLTQFRVIVRRDLDGAHAEVLRMLAATDPSTGCNNREAWRDLMSRELVRSHDHCRPLGVVLVRVDQLREVNERLGTNAADATLHEVSRRVEKRLQPYDSLARWAWDEFAIARFEVASEDARQFAEQLRLDIAQTPVKWEGHDHTITVSAGVVCAPGGTWLQVDTLMLEADRRIREALRGGGNRVIGPLDM